MRNLLLILTSLCLTVCTMASDQLMVVHEWGTFTSLQNDAGATLGGINADDEALPSFVKTLKRDLIASPANKGFAHARPDVTMRLETPVVYFHPPKNQVAPTTLDFEVQFKGGWLTQYYPDADALAPGMSERLKSNTLGSLSWHGLRVGVDAAPAETDLNVWKAPRAVDAATVANAKGQAEKFLFYRGVGYLNAPLKAVRTGRDELVIQPQLDPALQASLGLAIRTLWLAHFKADGTCAFTELRPDNFMLNVPDSRLTIKTAFSPGAYSAENLSALRTAMRKELVADGLFADEAEALLKTWEASYFKNAGLRLFFLVPKPWTNYYLPVKVSVPSEVVRTMVGRVELISPEKNAALDHLAAATDFSDKGLEALQPDINVLGRFKTPLLADRMKTQPTPGIKQAMNLFAMPVYQFPNGQ
ncbi:MAG TPA: hypothetical protein VKX17_13435 [Planctomycetota bacterium]|nr:hypothetical protein [Planctomycetota bacterium]